MSRGARTIVGTGPVGAPRPLHDRPVAVPASTTTQTAPQDAAPVVDAPGRGRGSFGTWMSGWARPSRALPVVAGVLVLAVGAVVVTGSSPSGPGPGEALVEVEGSVVVHRSDGAIETVTDRTRLEPGDRMEVRDGSAQLELSGGVRFSALDEDGRVPATDLTMARVPQLSSGSLLVVAPDGTSLESGSGRVRFAGGSVARVTRTAAMRVQVFRGRGVVSSAGAEQVVGALRQAEVVAAGEVTRTRPISYRSSDPWDRRYLGPALSLDRQLQALVRGMRAERVDGAALAVRLWRAATDAPERAGFDRLLAQRKDAVDSAVGVAVVGAGQDGTYVGRWRQAFPFHDAGAPWGLVAMDLAVEPDAVVDALGQVLQGAAPQGSATGGSGDELAGALIDPATGLPVASGPGAGTSVPGGAATTVPGGAGPGPGGPALGPTVPSLPVPGRGVTIPPVTGLPGVTIPPATLVPGVSLPTGTVLPGVTLPSLPVTIPAVTAPPVSLPPVTIRGVTLPLALPVGRQVLSGGGLLSP